MGSVLVIQCLGRLLWLTQTQQKIIRWGGGDIFICLFVWLMGLQWVQDALLGSTAHHSPSAQRREAASVSAGGNQHGGEPQYPSRPSPQ